MRSVRGFVSIGVVLPLAAVACSSDRASSPTDRADAQLPGDATSHAPREDLRTAEVSNQHQVVFSEQEQADGQFTFLVNGKTFDPTRIDAEMPLGEVAEWVIVNESTEWHTFHIHVNDYQVVDVRLEDVPDVSNGSANDVRTGALDLLDTVKIPPEGHGHHAHPADQLHREVRLPLPHALPRGPRDDGRRRGDVSDWVGRRCP
jgi:FtsP/CotA-like multicopper oxidase with cupredoxin domain